MGISYIAECCNNHMGSLPLALELIDAAAGAGATHAKFQLFRADSYWSDIVRRERVRPFELPHLWLPHLRNHCHEKGIKFGVSVFAIDLVAQLKDTCDFVKIASGDLMWFDLLKEVASLQLPMVVSTGMASLEEIHMAVETIYAAGFKDKLSLLHCVSAYPAQEKDYNLRFIETLHQEFPAAEIGVSDHTQGLVFPVVAIVAVILGASVIEKHMRLTADRYPNVGTEKNHFPSILNSPDFGHSLTPNNFEHMIMKVKLALSCLGSGIKTGPIEVEEPIYDLVRRYNHKVLRG